MTTQTPATNLVIYPTFSDIWLVSIFADPKLFAIDPMISDILGISIPAMALAIIPKASIILSLVEVYLKSLWIEIVPEISYNEFKLGY